MRGIVSRCGVVLGTAALLVAVGVVPVSAVAVPGPVLRVFNPASGDVLPRGRYIFLGAAWDAGATDFTATAPAGVDRVSVFAGDRNLGGIWLGTAAKATCQSGTCPQIGGRNQGVGIQGSIGAPNPLDSGKFAKAGWTLKSRITLRKIHSGSLWFYARSAVTGQETIVKIDNISIDPGRAVPNIQP
jgi:hypothetical protein